MLITLTRTEVPGLAMSEEVARLADVGECEAPLARPGRNRAGGQRLSVLQIDVRDKPSTRNLEG